ncbi:DUF3392 domain-containing protein [Vibrio sp. JC009]|uniref:DUF3392 domain-containing protein n=1 Tax=Vibrio sp. JC009 TaxID=2912314 RepID=UPI0023AED6C4|nr:DUF3392 domain-containing protein [Vibrio sp. JC009]WED23034.1 DUF3392 domain-containing protein [Vibrio sp. JC009]
MLEVLAPVGKHIVPYTPEISTALVACLLVMFGSDINRFLRRTLSGQHFIVRTLAFILLNAFGYGMLIVYAAPYLSRQLRELNPGDMMALVVVSFIVIGMWAQRNRHV